MLEFLRPLDIGYIWGIGPKTKAALNRMGINIIGELAKYDKNQLVSMLGRNGIAFWEMARGIDESEVETAREIKSVSSEMTFEKDTLDKKLIEKELINLCEEVSARLRQDGFKCRTITLKIRLEGFETHTRSVTIPEPANLFDVIYKEIKRLYNNFEAGNKKVRLLGVRASGLSGIEEQYSLFKDESESRKESVQKAVDKIREKFGKEAITRGPP